MITERKGVRKNLAISTPATLNAEWIYILTGTAAYRKPAGIHSHPTIATHRSGESCSHKRSRPTAAHRKPTGAYTFARWHYDQNALGERYK